MPKQARLRPTNEELPGLNNPNDLPWLRQKGESWQAYYAFAAYRDLGPSRNHAKTRDQVGCNISLIHKWSAKWMWVDRASSFDADESYERMVRMRERRIKLWENDASIARKVKDKVIARLNSMSPNEMSVSQMIQAWKVAHEIETKALGAGSAEADIQSPAIDEEMVEFEKWLEENPEAADLAADFIRARRQQVR